MLRTYFTIAIALLILIAIIHPSTMESRRSHYSFESRHHLERLQIALSDFYHDFKAYPTSVPVGTDRMALTRDNHERAFKIFKGVYIILKTNDSQYAAIAGHPDSRKFYAISDVNETVYRRQHTDADGDISKDRLIEMLVQSCPAPGEKDWHTWQASTHWNEMNSLPKIALAIGFIGLCLLLATLVKAVWQGAIGKLFHKDKNKTTSATETSSIFL